MIHFYDEIDFADLSSLRIGDTFLIELVSPSKATYGDIESTRIVLEAVKKSETSFSISVKSAEVVNTEALILSALAALERGGKDEIS